SITGSREQLVTRATSEAPTTMDLPRGRAIVVSRRRFIVPNERTVYVPPHPTLVNQPRLRRHLVECHRRLYPQVFGKYVLERELSRGGMARVVLATLRGAGGFEKKLVVKQIRDELAFDQQFIRRFVEEAKTTVALSHPNIVPVYELGMEQGTYFLAMELVEGVSVAELLRERNEDGSRRVLSPEEGAYVGIEVCRALDYAHRRMKVVHRDITPRNVMIDEEGQIKLIDFGIAAPALVAGHEILGSPGHMAPEQVDGGELGPPTDIFAVAVLLMEAWTGSAPFRRATPEECAAAVRERHPKPGDFDARLLPLDDAIGRAMQVDARARQQEASELARSLRAFLQGLDVADIARALGDRVRDLRVSTAASAQVSRSEAPRPSTASVGELGTKTFAAREEALRWSRPPESFDGPPAPSTRRLAESKPDDGAARPARGRRDDPAMAIATPLMVDVEELEKIHGEISAARAEKRSERPPPGDGRRPSEVSTAKRKKVSLPNDGSPPEKLETIATRPFETPVRAPTSSSATAFARSKALLGVVALVGLGGFAVWRMRDAPSSDERLSATTATTAPPVTASVASGASIGSAPGTHVAEPAATGKLVPPVPVGASASGVPINAAAAGRASVAFLGEPGTRVSIDGASRGPCPVRISLAEGAHEVRFTFDPTGESRGERFTVKSGEQVTVRAEFTRATPTVKILR
ncbi:MAG TPA: protein kinase, partial [Labilithrix sp.]|nr:protein kinase [Labilithrix sp.]